MITLREQLRVINFRRMEESLHGSDMYDTITVRIYDPSNGLQWFEFGVHDFGEGRDEYIEKILTDDILSKEVDAISHNADLDVMRIWLVGGQQ